MPILPSWVPLRWPAEWRDPAQLQLIANTPLNCLILDWSTAQAEPLKALVGAARAAGLALVGRLSKDADQASAAAAAEQAGLSALAAEHPVKSKLPTIVWCERAKLPWDSDQPVLATDESVWPGVQRPSAGEAGPTGGPWIDANGWFLQLARARAPRKALWFGFQPPKDRDFLRGPDYALAVADCAGFGGRWVVALDAKLRTGLQAGNASARDTWKALLDALSFFGRHPEWSAAEPLGAVAVISDFSGDDEYFAGEVLNLMARRGIPYKIFLKSQAGQADFTGLVGIVYADQAPPAAPLGRKLVAFARAGGLVLAGQKWPHKEGAPTVDLYRRYDIFPTGKGRIAVSREEAMDPYLVAADTQILTSNRHVPVKFFNAGTLMYSYTGCKDRSTTLLQITNYSMRSFGGPVSAAFNRRFRSARMWNLGQPDAKPLEVHVQGSMGSELHLPPFNLYAVIELEA